MDASGSPASFTVKLLLVLLLALGGLFEILAPSGSTLLGIALLLAGCGLYAYARNARAAYLHRQKLTGLEHWAQGLGPQAGQERRRR